MAVLAALVGASVLGVGSSVPVSAATPAPSVAYGFNEGAGTAVADSSGNARNGTAVSATWANAGRYGSAISFNGSSTRVTSSAPVSLGSAFTLMTWVLNPAASGYETVAAIGTSRDLYLYNGTLWFHDGSGDRSMGAVVAPGRWVHVAVTYDGSSLRAFVDGAAAGSPLALSLPSVSAPVQVGAWPSGSGNYDAFSGTIDEVRLYPRALTLDEIRTDMTTPISAGVVADTSPPLISAGLPTGTLAAGTTQTTVQVTTNESATCRYGTIPGVVYGLMASAFAATGGTTHTTPVSGLVDSGTYSFAVRCMDAAGNADGSDATVAFAVGSAASPGRSSLRFFGNGTGGIDRVRIPLTPSKTVNVGGDLTIEWWMKTSGPLVNDSCGTSNDAWIYGNILIDRDVYGAGDYGDYGISLFGTGGGTIAFGVSRGSTGTTLCSTIGVADGAWHHVAVTRSTSSGAMAIFIDGQQRGTRTGPTGQIAYREGRSSSAANDPYLVLGAEKHDAGAQFPSYRGWMDELRVSNTVRYTANFVAPQALSRDASTVALYHFDEGTGTVLGDITGANPGTLRVGGSPVGPLWSTDVPF